MSEASDEELEAIEAAAAAFLGSDKSLAFIPYLFGFAFAWFILGMFVMQVLYWLRTSAKKDRWLIRSMVMILCALCIIHIVLLTRLIVTGFALNFGTYSTFFHFREIATTFILTTLIQFTVSSFFAYRAYRLTRKSKAAVIVPITLLIMSVALCIAVRINAPLITKGLSYREDPLTFSLLISWASTAMLADTILTGTIACALLRSQLGFAGFDRTDILIRKVVILSVEAQMIPTVCSAAFLITYSVCDGESLSAIWLFIPYIYAMALLAVLNSRKGLQRQLGPQMPEGLSQVATLQLPTLDVDRGGSQSTTNQSETVRDHLSTIAGRSSSERGWSPIRKQKMEEYPSLKEVGEEEALEGK